MSAKNLFLIAIVLFIAIFYFEDILKAHHGGLSIEWEEAEQKSIQWEQEVISNGLKIRFLSYPQNPIIKEETRLVFEVQKVETGIYLNGLEVKIHLKGPALEEDLTASEVKGVAGYYEITKIFPSEGSYTITFESEADGKTILANFTKNVLKPKINPYKIIGKVVVLSATAVTFLGTLLSLLRARRFLPKSNPVS